MPQSTAVNGVTFTISGNRQAELADYISQLTATSDFQTQTKFIASAGITNVVITSNPNDLPASERATAYNDGNYPAPFLWRRF
jgi:hypothetical protein